MLYSIQLFDCMKQLLLLLILYNGIYTRTYGYLLLDMLRKAVEIVGQQHEYRYQNQCYGYRNGCGKCQSEMPDDIFICHF